MMVYNCYVISTGTLPTKNVLNVNDYSGDIMPRAVPRRTADFILIKWAQRDLNPRPIDYESG